VRRLAWSHPRALPRSGPLLPGSRRGLRDRSRHGSRGAVGRVRRLAWSHPRALPRSGPLLPGSRR
jgi:hypothetical protein